MTLRNGALYGLSACVFAFTFTRVFLFSLDGNAASMSILQVFVVDLILFPLALLLRFHLLLLGGLKGGISESERETLNVVAIVAAAAGAVMGFVSFVLSGPAALSFPQKHIVFAGIWSSGVLTFLVWLDRSIIQVRNHRVAFGGHSKVALLSLVIFPATFLAAFVLLDMAKESFLRTTFFITFLSLSLLALALILLFTFRRGLCWLKQLFLDTSDVLFYGYFTLVIGLALALIAVTGGPVSYPQFVLVLVQVLSLALVLTFWFLGRRRNGSLVGQI